MEAVNAAIVRDLTKDEIARRGWKALVFNSGFAHIEREIRGTRGEPQRREKIIIDREHFLATAEVASISRTELQHPPAIKVDGVLLDHGPDVFQITRWSEVPVHNVAPWLCR